MHAHTLEGQQNFRWESKVIPHYRESWADSRILRSSLMHVAEDLLIAQQFCIMRTTSVTGRRSEMLAILSASDGDAAWAAASELKDVTAKVLLSLSISGLTLVMESPKLGQRLKLLESFSSLDTLTLGFRDSITKVWPEIERLSNTFAVTPFSVDTQYRLTSCEWSHFNSLPQSIIFKEHFRKNTYQGSTTTLNVAPFTATTSI